MIAQITMRYFALPSAEWPRLNNLLALHRKEAPSPNVATAIVAEDEAGAIVFAAFFLLALHFDNLIGMPNSGASISELHKVLERRLLTQLAVGETLTYYTNVRDDPKALAAAAKNGLVPMGGIVPHSRVIVRRR